MIIDAHTHTFPPAIADKVVASLQQKAQSKAYTAGTDTALQQSMKEAAIDISLLLPVMTNPGQVEKLNDIALQKNEQSQSTGIVSLGGMHPDYENYAAELKRIASRGIPGIKLHPAYQNTDLDDMRYLRIIEKAAELELAVVIHAGLDIGIMHHNFASVAHIKTILSTIHPDKFVLAHMGGWKDWDSVEAELCGENVYFDTSFSLVAYVPPEGVFVPEQKRQMLQKEQFERIVKKHGAEKILFGSDSPWSHQAESVKQIKELNFSEEALKNILYKNAKKLFSL
ncbi:MAG: amidohydrolase family protein [Clostridia bacterium]|nr:amidohydrolase family protein [Clostridia bacterium]